MHSGRAWRSSRRVSTSENHPDHPFHQLDACRHDRGEFNLQTGLFIQTVCEETAYPREVPVLAAFFSAPAAIKGLRKQVLVIENMVEIQPRSDLPVAVGLPQQRLREAKGILFREGLTITLTGSGKEGKGVEFRTSQCTEVPIFRPFTKELHTDH